MGQPDQWSALLQRLGLAGPDGEEHADGARSLEFAGMHVDLIDGSRARLLLDEHLSSADRIQPALPVDGTSAVICLGLPSDLEDRPLAAQRLCAMAALLVPFFGAHRLYWLPAKLWSEAEALAKAVVAMEATGMPPILHLVGFAASAHPDPDRRQLVTHGLVWFTGFEICIDAQAAMPTQEIMRRIARLAVDSLLYGDPQGPLELPGLQAGETVRIRPLQSRDGQWFLPVSIAGWRQL